MNSEALSENDAQERRLDEPLLRSLHALLTEASVSQAATRLGIAQSALSRHLKALRLITGDALLVRTGNRMVLTERGHSLIVPVRRILADMGQVAAESPNFEPRALRRTFRLATYDFLPKAFFADLVARAAAQAPDSEVIICGLGPRFEHYRLLEDGELDLVITIWPDLPPNLRSTGLLTEPIVCLMRRDHPLAGPALDLDTYGRAKHLSSLEHVPGQGTILDAQLAELGITVHTAMRTQFLSLAPGILERTDLVFSTGKLLAEDFAARHALAIVPFPGPIKPHRYKLVWHERTHKSQAMRWFRGEVVAAARALANRAVK